MKKILFILGIILLITSCQMKCRKGKIYEYKTQSPNNDDDFIFWYLITMSDGNSYYCQSSTPVSNFSNVNWSVGKPSELENIEPETEIDAETAELPAEMQAEVETSMEAEAASEASDSSSDSSSDAGGDSGGDGGGGGD